MKIAYFIFDSNIQEDRKLCVKNIKKEMSDVLFLQSKTIMISSKKDLKKSLLEFRPLDFHSCVRLGAAGLLLGTIKLYENAIDNDIDNLIVFEDDFIISSDFYKKILSILEERKSFDIISLYAHLNSLKDFDLLENKLLKNNHVSDLTIKHEEYGITPKLFSYVISSQGMKKFLDFAYSTAIKPVDLVLLGSPIPEMNTYVINPKVISMGTINNITDSGFAIKSLSNISRTKFVSEV
jgi:hypothetical protein